MLSDAAFRNILDDLNVALKAPHSILTGILMQGMTRIMEGIIGIMEGLSAVGYLGFDGAVDDSTSRAA
jgi:hypothetical protein